MAKHLGMEYVSLKVDVRVSGPKPENLGTALGLNGLWQIWKTATLVPLLRAKFLKHSLPITVVLPTDQANLGSLQPPCPGVTSPGWKLGYPRPLTKV